MAEHYVLDTSAILAVWQGEDGSNDVKEFINKAGRGECKLYLSFMTFFEAYYTTKRRAGESKALEIYYWLSNTLPAERVNLEEPILIRAGDLKIKHEISAIDAWILATGSFRNASVIHKDSEFDRIESPPIPLIRIPLTHSSSNS